MQPETSVPLVRLQNGHARRRILQEQAQSPHKLDAMSGQIDVFKPA
jgi:hypothetical protein